MILDETTSDPLKNISQQIKMLRKQNSWSQQKLAELTNLDRTTIGFLERNDYSDIGIRKALRVLQVFGKTLITADVGLPTLDQLQIMKSSTDLSEREING